jgi:hypothetical protein
MLARISVPLGIAGKAALGPCVCAMQVLTTNKNATDKANLRDIHNLVGRISADAMTTRVRRQVTKKKLPRSRA